jgi:hypothetical protein
MKNAFYSLSNAFLCDKNMSYVHRNAFFAVLCDYGTTKNAFYFFKIGFHIDEKVSDMSKNGRECFLFFLRTMLVYLDPIHPLKRIHSSMFFSQIIRKSFLILMESFLDHSKKERKGKYFNR